MVGMNAVLNTVGKLIPRLPVHEMNKEGFAKSSMMDGVIRIVMFAVRARICLWVKNYVIKFS